MPTSESTHIWIKDPAVLLKKNQINQVWPKKNMSRNEKINAITRLVLLLSLLGFLTTQSYNFFITGVVTLGVIILLYYANDYRASSNNIISTSQEGFTNQKVYESLKTNFTNPSENNPFMNVLLPEISKNPNRKMAAPAYNRAVEKQINKTTEDFVMSNFDNDKNIKKKLFSTLGDSFEFEDFGQYNFYATANTRIPNDQPGFAEFCYGGMTSGKEGNDFDLIKNNPRLGSITGQ